MARILGDITEEITPAPEMGGEMPTEKKGFSVENMVRNIPTSAGNFVGDIAQAVTNPVDTVKNIGKIAVGGIEKIIPGQQGEEESFDAVVNFYKDRYGSMDNFLKTLEEDPVGVASDVSLALTGVGGVAKAGVKMGTLGKATQVAGETSKAMKVADSISTAGKMMDPLNVFNPLVRKVKEFSTSLALKLEEMSLRLTPTQKAELLNSKTGAKLNELTDFMSKQDFNGSPQTRVDKADALLQTKEAQLQEFLGSIKKGAGASKQSVIKGLQQIKSKFNQDIDYMDISRRIDKAVATVQKTQEAVIPYKNLNEMKRSAFENAFNDAGTKVRSDVEFAIGDLFRDRIVKDLDGLKINGHTITDFNKDYGKTIQSKALFKVASGKPWMSRVSEMLLGGAIGSLTGFGAGGPATAFFGAFAGPSVIGQLPITAIRTATSKGLRKLENMTFPLSPENIQNVKTGANIISKENDIEDKRSLIPMQ